MDARKGSLARAARDLNSAAIHLLRGMRAADRESGLTPARLSALSVLVFGGACTLGELARAEEVSAPTMTRIVDGLVELRLATREPHPDSGRQVLVTATEEGTALMQRAADLRVAVIVDAMRSLAVADRQAVVAAAPALRELSGRVPAAAADRVRRGPAGSGRSGAR